MTSLYSPGWVGTLVISADRNPLSSSLNEDVLHCTPWGGIGGGGGSIDGRQWLDEGWGVLSQRLNLIEEGVV